MAASMAFSLGLVVQGVSAQVGLEDAVVTVDDSPAAQQLFQEAVAQAAENPTRTARLAMRLLDEYPDRLLPAEADDPDAFLPVRTQVIRLLKSREALINAWRQEAAASADALLETVSPQETFDRRPLTPAGFEAGRRVAQARLESARYPSALRLVEELRSWPEGRMDDSALLVMEAIAARLEAKRQVGQNRLELEAVWDEAVERLRRLDAERAARLERMVDRHEDRRLEPSRSSTEASSARVEDFREDAWTRIWDDELSDTLFRRR